MRLVERECHSLTPLTSLTHSLTHSSGEHNHQLPIDIKCIDSVMYHDLTQNGRQSHSLVEIQRDLPHAIKEII